MSTIAVNFLLLMYPQGPWCLAACKPDKTAIEVRTFTKPDLAQQWIDSWNGERNLYFHINPPRTIHAAKKLKKTEVLSLNYLHIDIDTSPGEAFDDKFRARAMGLLTHDRPPGVHMPTAIVFSGGGYQAFWKLREELPLDGTEAEAEDAKLYNVALEQLLGGDHCHNIDRLMRLPGTWNLPTPQKVAKGREKTEAQLISFDASLTYGLSEFRKANPDSASSGTSAAALSADSSSSAAVGGAHDVEIGTHPFLASLDELDEWKVPTRVKTVLAQGRDADNPKKGDDSRSAWLYDAICQLIRFGVPDAVIYAVVTDPGWKISDSVIDKKSKADSYARRQIEKAHGKAKLGEHSPTAQPQGPGNGAGNGSGNGSGSGGSSGNGGFRLDRNNNPIAVGPAGIDNKRLALNLLGIVVRHDLFADRNLIIKDGQDEESIQDHHVDKIYYDAQREFNLCVSIEEWHRFLSNESRHNSFHPVLDYIKGIEWDGKPRIETWLIDYAGVKDTPYTRAVSKLVLVGAVRRVREPGCRFQEMLVLISAEQGKGKSTALAALCPNRSWFTDDLPLSADAKTIIERLSGKWIVEAAELKGMRNSDVEHLKAFLSRERDMARMAYERIPKEHRRQSIIVGTTNALYFLRDSTGNRRFWPVYLGKSIDKADIIAIRDQLWAEAALAESQWQGDVQLAKDLWGEAGEEQTAAKLEDPYYEMLSETLQDMEGIITSNDVWTVLGVAPERRSTQSQHMGEAMRHLGFERDQRRFGNGRKESCYKRGESKLRILVFRNNLGKVSVELAGQEKYPAEDRQF